MEFKDRWLMMVFLVLLIFTLVVTQTKREILLTGGPLRAGLPSLSYAHMDENPYHKVVHSSEPKTVALFCGDKFLTLFDLLEIILDPGLVNKCSQNFVGTMEKDFSKFRETIK